MELRGEGKGVHVDTDSGHVGVVLVGLHLVEVASLAELEAVMSVQLEESTNDGVPSSIAIIGTRGISGKSIVILDTLGHIPHISVVERLLALESLNDGIVAGHEGVALHNPDKLLNGVVEVELDLVGGGGDRLGTSELHDIDEVLVSSLGELPALINIEVDVVNVERGSDEASGGHAVTDGVHVGGTNGGVLVPAEVAEVIELEVDAHLVVLEGDEGKSKTRVAAEPELEGHVEGILGGALPLGGLGGVLVTRSRAAIRVAVSSIGIDSVSQGGHIANHLGIAGLLTGLLGKLIPDMKPIAILFVSRITL